MTWSTWADGELASIRAAGRWRFTRELDLLGPRGQLGEGPVPITSFASNDYLGLSTHPAVIAAAHAALDRWGTGSTASRLVVGTRPIHHELEAELAAWKQCPAALLFPTGYAANLGALGTLAGPGVTVCSDELNHASIIDGCRLARADVQIYRHRDLDHLASLLRRPGRSIVVTDSVFSMDGDEADLDGLFELCASSEALLVLDEAHAVLGPDVSDASDFDGVEVLRIGTLSKSLGSLGGFVAGPQSLIDLLRNRARPFIFSTALTPADSAAALAALAIVRGVEGDALRDRLRGYIDKVRPGHPSPIVPVILGSEERALAAADALLEQGLLVPAIRPPTVAPGTSRLRVTLSAGHTDAEVDLLVAALSTIEAELVDAP